MILTSLPVKTWLTNDKNKQTYKTKTNKNHKSIVNSCKNESKLNVGKKALQQSYIHLLL